MNRTKGYFIFLLILISSSVISLNFIEQAYGQPIVAPPIEWQSTYRGFKVEQIVNGDYILFGSNRLTKLDSSGELIWTATYSTVFWSGDQCSDGGYVLVGDTSLVKTDGTGVIQWQRTYEEAGFLIRFRSVQQTSDDGYVLAGWRIPDGVNNNDFFLIKTDASGSIEFNHTYGEVSANEMAYDVLQASDDGFVLVGEQFSFSSSWTDG
jgi:hypothetical protein